MRWFAIVLTAVLVVTIACGGSKSDGGDDGSTPSAQPTAQPTAQPAAQLTPTINATEEYRTAVGDIIIEGLDVMGEEWPAALGTEPVGGTEWQAEVFRLAAKIETLRLRLEALSPPPIEYATSHTLMLNALERTAAAVEVVGVSGANADIAALESASAEISVGLAILLEATEEFFTAQD